MNNDQNIIGTISLDNYTELHFIVSYFRKNYFANVRQFLKTPRYTGYSKKGIVFKLATLESFINILDNFSPHQNIDFEQEIGKISKNNITDIIIRLVKGQKDSYVLDIREYLKSDRYEGWTKKGIRIPLEYFDDAKVYFYACRDELIKVSNKVMPTKLVHTNQKLISDSTEVLEILGGKLLGFPENFIELANSKQLEKVTLPKGTLKLGAFKEGVQYVVSEDDFMLELRNEIEAKYIIYAHLRGATSVSIPADMFVIFKAVKEYEKYVRDIQKKLIEVYKVQYSNYLVIKHKVRLELEKLGLPWLEEGI